MSDEYWEPVPPEPVRTDYGNIALLVVFVAETSVYLTAQVVVQTGERVELFIKSSNGEELRVACFNESYGWCLAVAEVQNAANIHEMVQALKDAAESREESKKATPTKGGVMYPNFQWKPKGEDDDPPPAS